MANEGRLIAVDKDAKRFETLEKLLSHRGITCVETLNQDFRSVDPSDYADATVILVDPSCSSSGTSVHEDELSKERVLRLASFQLQVLSHALSFPSVKTVVYSTCSVNEEENEAVVMKALSQFSSFHLEDLRGALPGWKHFGLEKYDFGALCLRTNPSVDLCQGFFVAKFVKDRIKSKKRKKSKKEGEKKE
ncbi:UNVERIFIED_CONTAM: hypothetical protein GTU68_026519, partial [Idotea baltica]|nr:hypothetical protein [Idotea baltica]